MKKIQKFNLEDLAKFLVNAKRNSYAAQDSNTVQAERPDFKELVYSEGDFSYRDSYCGFFQAPGMEVVRFKGEPVWTMAYSGGMLDGNQDVEFAGQVFGFLKNALKAVSVEAPYRGPKLLNKLGWRYLNDSRGDISRFFGHERVLYWNKEVFSQDYIGGLVIGK